MLRLLTMCIPFRNLRKKGRAFLRDFLSDYDRNARRSMRAWRRHAVAGRTILILEPNYCHGEVLPGCSAPLEVRLPSSFTSGEDTLYVSRAIARCRSVALTSEKLYHYGLGGPQSVSSRNRKAETRPASYYAVFEMLTREKLREGVLGSNRTAYMNYIVPLLFPDNEMPAGRLRHWAELWREADITSEHVCGMPREQRAYLEAALAGRRIYLRLLQCFWKFKTARRKMFRLRFSKNGIDTLQILGYTLYSAKKLPRSSL